MVGSSQLQLCIDGKWVQFVGWLVGCHCIHSTYNIHELEAGVKSPRKQPIVTRLVHLHGVGSGSTGSCSYEKSQAMLDLVGEVSISVVLCCIKLCVRA